MPVRQRWEATDDLKCTHPEFWMIKFFWLFSSIMLYICYCILSIYIIIYSIRKWCLEYFRIIMNYLVTDPWSLVSTLSYSAASQWRCRRQHVAHRWKLQQVGQSAHKATGGVAKAVQKNEDTLVAGIDQKPGSCSHQIADKWKFIRILGWDFDP